MNHKNADRPAISSSMTRAAALALTGVALTGCSLFQTGVALQDAPLKPATTRPALAAGEKPATPADVMFTSTEPATPFSKPASTVNVFGEVDGIGPSPFGGAGATGFQQHTFVDEGYDADPSISPDGQWLLFASTRHSEHADLYLQRTDGLAVTQLTSDDADDAYPRFSRDGKQITFASNRAGNWDIYVMDADGTRVRQLTRSPAQELHPTFSPDGSRIAFSSLGTRSGQWELWTIDLRNNERRMIGYGLFPDWSPRADRDVIAFQRARQRGTRWFSAWTLELVDGEAHDMTEVAYSASAAIVAPTWNSAGTRLAFCTIPEPQKVAPSPKTGNAAKGQREDLWTITADGTDRRQITDGRGVNTSPVWSNDGRLYFISDRGGSEAIWSLAAERFGDGVNNARSASATPTVVDPFESKLAAPFSRRVAEAPVEAPIEKPVETTAEVPAQKPIAPQAEVTIRTPPTEAPVAHEEPVHEDGTHSKPAHGEPASASTHE
jgi:TolB protein